MQFTSNDFGDRLLKDKAPQAKQYAESLQNMVASRNYSLKAEFVTIMSLPEAQRKEFAEGCMAPLASELKDINKEFAANKNSSDLVAKNLTDLKMKTVKADHTFMEAYMAQTMQIFAAEAATGNLAPNQQVLLPLQYINTLGSSFRFIVPSEVATQAAFIRQKTRKYGYISGDTTEYPFPDALKNKTFLNAVLGADNQPTTWTVKLSEHPSTQVLDLLTPFGASIVKGKDKIGNLVRIKSITIDGVKKVLAASYNTTIDPLKKGDFTITLPTAVPGTKSFLGGEVNFEKSEMVFNASSDITEFELELTLRSGTFGRGIRTKEVKEQMHYAIDRHIQGTFSYNYREVMDKMNFENTDLVVLAAEIMTEIMEAAKDHYGYTEMDNKHAELTSLKAAGGLTSDDYVDGYTVNLGPDPTKIAVVTDNPGALRNTFINDGFSKLGLGFKTKYNPRAGFVTNMWTNLEVGRIVGPEESIITAGDSYAGVTANTTVRAGAVKGYQFKLVETQREDNTSTEIKMAPVFNDANMETFKFFQWETKMFNDNSYRDPSNMAAPSFHMVDHFKLLSIQAAMAKLNITNKDHLMGGPIA